MQRAPVARHACMHPLTHRTVLPPHCHRTATVPHRLAAEKYEWITKRKIGPALGFVEELEQRGIPYWLRYVLMPGKTDGPEDVAALLEFCRGKRSMQAIEVLPYHLLGLEVGAAAAQRSTGQCSRGACQGSERHAEEGHAVTPASIHPWPAVLSGGTELGCLPFHPPLPLPRRSGSQRGWSIRWRACRAPQCSKWKASCKLSRQAASRCCAASPPRPPSERRLPACPQQ